MIAAGQSERERKLAERVMRFYELPQSLVVANRYLKWRKTPAGYATMAKLNAFALLRIQNLVTQADYECALSEVAAESAIPLADVRVMAEGAYESRRCYYLAAGLVPVALGDWYAGTEVEHGN